MYVLNVPLGAVFDSSCHQLLSLALFTKLKWGDEIREARQSLRWQCALCYRRLVSLMIEKLIVNPTKKPIRKPTKKSTVYKASVEKEVAVPKAPWLYRGLR